jgi:hypothetical protein
MILWTPCDAHECWQLRYVVPSSNEFACATLWRWPGGRCKVRLVTLGEVRETRRLRSHFDIAAYLGLSGHIFRDRWQRLDQPE